MPAISVIVPVYNMASSLERAVDSLLNQSFVDFEAILVDDGSTDDSGALCDAYALKDSRIKVIHQKNGGVSAARNAGMNIATGEWMVTLDADDWAGPRWLELFASGFASGADLIVQGYKKTEIDGSENVFEYKDQVCGRRDAAEVLMGDEIKGVVWNKVFRMSIVREKSMLFEQGLVPAEDEVFTSEYLSYSDKVCFVSGAQYVYYVPDWDSKYKRDGGWEVLFPAKAAIYGSFRRCGVQMKEKLDELCWLFHGSMKKTEFASVQRVRIMRRAVACDMDCLPLAKDVVFLLKYLKWDWLLLQIFRVRSHIKFYHFLQIKK